MSQTDIGNVWNAERYDQSHSFVWRFGSDVVELLNPQSGERILDIGSGTGHLAGRIAECGADVTGIDGSVEMVARARVAYPELNFYHIDARTLIDPTRIGPDAPAPALFADASFDAVFSNATLHWILEAETIVRGVARVLKPGCRFVAEMGGAGNIAEVRRAIAAGLKSLGYAMPVPRLFFPTLSSYTTLLEQHGFEVTQAQLFDRPTPLEGQHGLADWVKQFARHELDIVPAERHVELLDAIERHGHETLYDGRRWVADYRRLRFVAMRKP